MTERCLRNAAGLMLALAFAAATLLDGAPNYCVSGIVVDSRSHSPLANARVSLAPTTARDSKSEQVTKQDGRFSFALSQPGKYQLSMTKPGYPQQAYKQAAFAGVASAIVVRDGQDTSSLVFEAHRGGVISGLVKDEDSEPVGNAQITIFRLAIVDGQRRVLGRSQTRANASGEFRFSGLPRGSYYVCAMGRPWFADSLIELQEMQGSATTLQTKFKRAIPIAPGGGQSEEPDQSALEFSPDPVFRGTAFLTTFYPNAPSVDQASLVRVDAGGEMQISITLPLAKAVSVKGTINLPGESSSGRVYLCKNVYDYDVLFQNGLFSGDKTFEFDNVPPGSYEIMATSDAATGANSWHIRERLEVGASDMEVTLRPQEIGSLSGHVLFEGERPRPRVTFSLSPQ